MCHTILARWPKLGSSRIAIAVIVIVTMALAFADWSSPAAAPLAGGLITTIDGSYDVHPDEGVAHAQWSATIRNTGPSPWLPEGDPLNQPSTIDIFIPDGFTDFRATIGGGAPLPVTYDDKGYASIATVQLGYTLAYGDALNLDYSYTIGGSYISGVYISPTYIYIWGGDGVAMPTTYDSAVLHITMPTLYANNSSFDFGDCETSSSGSDTTFTCYGDESGVQAYFEVIDEGSRISVPQDFDIDGRNVNLILRYWAGDDTWADRARQLITDVLPVYARLFGAAYDGPSTIRISEKGGSEIYGNRGLALCQNTICALAVTPAADDQVTLHEISHMWSDPFHSRWLIEGIAEYVSRKAAAELAIPDFEEFSDPEKAPQATARDWLRPESEVLATEPDFDLDAWGWGPEAFAISPQSAYSWGARFWQEIEILYGPEPFAKVMADIQWKVADGTIDSEAIMDELEDVGGVKADDLFKSYVFADDKYPILDKRREARDRLDALQARSAEEAPELDTAVFAPIRAAILDWRFDAALDSLSELEPALDAYLSIQGDLDELRVRAEAAGLSFPYPWEEGNHTWAFNTDVVDELDGAYEAIDAYETALADFQEPRSFLQRVGLLGRNDRAEIDEAAGHFAWARFDQSIEHSTRSEKMIAGASSDGLTYLIVLGIVAASMIAFVVVVYSLSREPKPATAAGTESGSS